MKLREVMVAGTPKGFNVTGNYFRFKSRTGVLADQLSVQFFRDGRLLEIDRDDVDSGDWARVPEPGFNRVEITSAEAGTVEFEVARGDVGSDRVSGVVEVVEGGLARTLAGIAFSCRIQQVAVAAEYSYVQLWNPVASGKNLIVNKIAVSAGAAAALLDVRGFDASFADLASNPQSKKINAALSVAECRRDTDASPNTGDALYAVYVPANTSALIPLVEPFVVPPGNGLGCMNFVANNELVMSLDHWEQSV